MVRKGWLATVVVATVLAVPGTAFAHVEITAANPPGTDDVVLTSLFAENECTDALNTVQLVFPTTPKLTVATPELAVGWTSVVEKQPGSEAVASVTWTNGHSHRGTAPTKVKVTTTKKGSDSSTGIIIGVAAAVLAMGAAALVFSRRKQ